MSRGGPLIAIATAQAARGLDEDEEFLSAALERAGIGYRVEAWDDAAVSWEAYELVIVRSTWDYTARRADFLAWADRVAATTTLVNPPDILRWSTDKHYLADLAARGVPIVPTMFFEVGDSGEVGAIDGEVVVKPAVGAGSADCARYRDAGGAEVHVRRLLVQGRAVLVQPYLAAVDDEGEAALVYFDGRFSHAIRKGPILAAPIELIGGLFAREDITGREVSSDELAVAEAALRAVPTPQRHRPPHEPLVYARVDLVPGPDGPLVLELELCEPSLFLAHDPGAADRLVSAVASRLGRPLQ